MKKDSVAYKFYFNFPTVKKKKKFLIHKLNVCNSEAEGSTINGFWAKDFKNCNVTESVLKKLIRKYRDDSNYSICRCPTCFT